MNDVRIPGKSVGHGNHHVKSNDENVSLASNWIEEERQDACYGKRVEKVARCNPAVHAISLSLPPELDTAFIWNLHSPVCELHLPARRLYSTLWSAAFTIKASLGLARRASLSLFLHGTSSALSASFRPFPRIAVSFQATFQVS